LSGELLEVVLVPRSDVRLLRVLLVLLVSCRKELYVLWPRAFLRLLSLISSYGIWPALFRTCPVLLFVAWHGVYGLLFSLFLLFIARFWPLDSSSYSRALGDMFDSDSSEDLTSGAVGASVVAAES
jgi:hypothetical protein